MITNITLQNFKCFRQLEINPKLVTVFIGPNGAGKSSVLQALLLLKQSVGTDRINHQGDYINLSDPEDLVPNFLSEPLPIQIGFQGNVATGPWLTQTDFGAGAGFRYFAYFSSDLTPTPYSELPKIHSAPGSALEQLRVVPAARGLVRPKYALGDKYEEQVSLRDGLSGQEERLAANLAHSSSSEETLSKLLKKVTGTGLWAKTVPPQSVEVKSVTPSGAVNIVTEGFGANALILLLHQLISAEKGSTVLIEEPEIHLHPKAQAELAQVLTDTAKADGKQIIMTTHSEHLVSRLLTMVAEKKLPKEEVAIYSFEKDDEGICSASEIEVTDRGQTIGGLKGFLDTNLDEMDRYVKALQTNS